MIQNQLLSSEETFCWDLEKPFSHLPSFTTYHLIQGTHLVIAPNIPSWLVLDDIGFDLYSLCKDQVPLIHAFTLLPEKYQVSLQECDQHIEQFLQQVLDQGFLQDKTVNPGELCLPELHQQGRVILHVTNKCNLTCPQCYMNSGRPLDHELTFEEWIQLIDDISIWNPGGQIIFSGGEPFLHPQLLELVAYAKYKNNITMLITNGTACQDIKLFEDIVSILDNIQISIDGASPETHDAVRGKGSFQKVMTTISHLKRLNRKFDLAMCLLDSNVEDLTSHVVRFIQSIGQEYINVFSMSPVMQQGRGKNLKTAFSLGESEHVINSLRSQLKARGILLRDPRVLIPGNNLANCAAGIVMEIHANGNIGFCYFKKIFGNTRTSKFIDIATQIQTFQVSTNVTQLEHCKTCDLKLICKGGCKANYMMLQGDATSVICNDHIKNAYYSKLVTQAN